MKTVPLWIVASLGKQVALVKDFVGSCETYRAGCRGRLVSIQAGDDDMHVTVQLDPNDSGYEENFGLDEIRQVEQDVSFSLDLEHGVIRF